MSILASCMDNLSKFNVVFSSSTLIYSTSFCFKDALEGHLCQTFNNVIKQNKSTLRMNNNNNFQLYQIIDHSSSLDRSY